MLNNDLSFTEEMAIACCRCCLLAESMKTCKVCPFKAGLIYRDFDRLSESVKENEADNVRLNSLKSLILA
jgi:hypothetical protein